MKFIAELRDVQLKSRLVFTGKMNRQYVVGHKLLSAGCSLWSSRKQMRWMAPAHGI
jgi:hypothetical protein